MGTYNVYATVHRTKKSWGSYGLFDQDSTYYSTVLLNSWKEFSNSVVQTINECYGNPKIGGIKSKIYTSASCREVVVSTVRNFWDYYSKGGWAYTCPTIHVEIVNENHFSMYVENQFVKNCLEFHQRFFEQNLEKRFRIDYESGHLVFSMALTGAAADDAYTVSYFLYLFRQQQIVEACLKRFPQPIRSLTPLYKYLATAFLTENNGWGNGANSNLYLSIFSYVKSTGTNYVTTYNGPSNGGRMTDFANVVSYLNKIYFPAFPDYRDITEVPGLYYGDSDNLVNSMREIIRLYRNLAETSPEKLPKNTMRPVEVNVDEDYEDDDEED
jgi:hypothetical protein